MTSGSVLFCSKGVVAKLAYGHGLDALSVLNLRMLIALPFFLVIAVLAAKGVPRLALSDWARLAALGFVGYYLSSLVNFTGLQYISVGLERVILFSYPGILLILSALVLWKRVPRTAWLAAAVAWIGILLAFGAEARVPVADGNRPLGSLLVLLSAVIYASYILMAGDAIRRVGAMLFGSIAVGFSCIFMCTHFMIVYSVDDLFSYPAVVYGHGLTLAVFGTVAPALLMSVGLERAGPQRFAVMGAIGPVATLFLAWAVLGEQPNGLQVLGLMFALAGGIAIVRLKG